MNEIWRDITDYEGLYQVSNLGRVRSLDRIVYSAPCQRQQPYSKTLKGCILKQNVAPSGYVQVVLSKCSKTKTHKVHRLVAMAFPEICGEWFDGAEVNHKDECKTNNTATNLETCSHCYNMRYGGRGKKQAAKKGIPVLQILNGVVVKKWKSAKEAEKAGVVKSSSEITKRCKKHKSTPYSGFDWEYAAEP